MIIGIVLTGGGSRRMGTSKAELVLADRLSAGRAVAALLRPVVDQLLVVGAPLLGEQVAVLDDPREGPLAAIAAVARASPGAAIIACTCDAPFIPPKILAALARFPGSAGLVGPEGPLVFPARVGSENLPALISAADNGERRARWLIAQRTDTLAVDRETAARCVGANTKDEWDAMCALYDTRDAPA